MKEAFTWITENGEAIWGIASTIVTAAALIAALTPSPKDDSWVAKVRGVIDKLGLNWGFAKNEKPKK